MTNFDCLNTELLLEIFDYLSFSDLFLAFFNLQQRINNAIRAYPSCVDLSKVIDRKALKHGPFTCRTLIVFDSDTKENETDYLYIDFHAIRKIEFKYVNINTLHAYFERIPMQQIESIKIENLAVFNSLADTDKQLWSIIAIAGQNQLRYLCVCLRIIRWDVEQLLFDLPSLQDAIFKNISAEEMLLFMRHTPNLRSFTGRITNWDNDNYPCDFHLYKLIHLNLYVENCNSFDELHQVLSVCSYVTEFELRFWITGHNEDMVNAKGWQTLIEHCLPCLKYLRIRLFRYIRIPDETNFDDDFDLSEYWLRKKPHFDIQV